MRKSEIQTPLQKRGLSCQKIILLSHSFPQSFLLVAGRAEATLATLGFIKAVHLNDLHVQHRGDHHLGDAHAALDDEILLAVVDHQDLDLAVFISVAK